MFLSLLIPVSDYGFAPWRNAAAQSCVSALTTGAERVARVAEHMRTWDFCSGGTGWAQKPLALQPLQGHPIFV